MSSQNFDASSIGPQMELDDLALPPHVGARAATLFGRAGRFATAGEWVDAVGEAAMAETGRAPTEADLCTDPDGAHSVEIDGWSQSYVCVLDPLGLPFLRGEPGTVRSTTPEDGATVTVDVTANGARADPGEAVVSLGVSRDVDPDGRPTREVIYRNACPYVHVFAAADEYDRWAEGVDASTTSLPVPTAVALVREMARELFDVEASETA